jgi:hypothetical protein
LAVTSSTASWLWALTPVSSEATNASVAEWLSGQAHHRARLAHTDHDLGDLVGGLEQRARVPVQAAASWRQCHAACRALEELRADLGLERRQTLGQRGLGHVQAHRCASKAAEVGGDAEAPQLVEVRGTWHMRATHDCTFP